MTVVVLFSILAFVACFWGGRLFERLAAPKKTDHQVGAPKPIKPPESPKPAGSPIGCPVGNCRIKTRHSHTEALIERLKDK
jgi:hypothetical protein